MRPLRRLASNPSSNLFGAWSSASQQPSCRYRGRGSGRRPLTPRPQAASAKAEHSWKTCKGDLCRRGLDRPQRETRYIPYDGWEGLPSAWTPQGDVHCPVSSHHFSKIFQFADCEVFPGAEFCNCRPGTCPPPGTVSWVGFLLILSYLVSIKDLQDSSRWSNVNRDRLSFNTFFRSLA